jgi:hypothetical protein
LAEPVPPLARPVVWSKLTSVVWSGWMISINWPSVPFLLANEDRAPGRAPHGVAIQRAAQDRLDLAVGQADPLDTGQAGVVGLVADDEMRRVRAVRPERDHVEIGARVRGARRDVHVQALRHGRECPGVGLGRLLVDAVV